MSARSNLLWQRYQKYLVAPRVSRGKPNKDRGHDTYIIIYIYNLYDTDPNKWHYNIYGQSFKYFIFENLQQFDTKTQNECCMDFCLKNINIKKSSQHGTCGINGINKFDLPKNGSKKMGPVWSPTPKLSLHQPGRRAPLTSQRDLMVAEEVARSKNLNQLQKRHPKRHQK